MKTSAARVPGAGRRAAIALAGSCHPVPSIAVSVLAFLMGAGVGLRPATLVTLTAAVFTGQLSIGWSNDRLDAVRDAVVGRTDKPAATGGLSPGLLSLAAGLSLAATAALSALLGVPAAAAALTLVAAGWAYNLGLKSTPFSGAAYLVGFAALGAVPYLARPAHPWPPWWAPVVGALLGLGAHFANVLPDLRADAATGVRGLPHRLGQRDGVLVMAGSLATAAIVLGVGAGRASALAWSAAGVGLAGAAVVAVVATRSPHSPHAFRITIVMAALDVALLVGLSR